MRICEIQVQIRGRRLGSHTEFCIQRINMATHLEFAQKYLILFTFCNNIVDPIRILQEMCPFLLAISILAGNNTTACLKDNQIYFNSDHPAFQVKVFCIIFL